MTHLLPRNVNNEPPTSATQSPSEAKTSNTPLQKVETSHKLELLLNDVFKFLAFRRLKSLMTLFV